MLLCFASLVLTLNQQMAPQLLTHSRAVLTRYVLLFVLLLLTKQQSVYIVGVGVNVFYIPYVSYYFGSGRQ